MVDDGTLTTTVQAGAQTSAFGVTGPRGTTFSPISFVLRPVIDFITPTSGRPGSYVTIVGAHFDALTEISFGGAPATRYTYVTGDDTAINVQVPRRAQTGPIVVGNAGGQAESQVFTVIGGTGAQDGAADPAALAGPGRELRCPRVPAPGAGACTPVAPARR